MNPFTVAIDARMLGISGSGTYVERLLSEYARIEHDFHFIVIGNGKALRPIIAQSPRFTLVESSVPVFSLSEQLKLPGLASRADLLHSLHHNVPIFRRGRLAVTFQDALHWDYPELVPGWKGKLYIKLVSRRIARADAVLVPSQFTAGRLAEKVHVPPERIHIVPLGVDGERFAPRPPEETRAIIEKYDIEPSGYLLYVGNIKPHKNILRLVEAYGMARKKGINIPLMLAGNWESLRMTVPKEKALSQDGVRYIGAVPFDDIPYLYCGARAFLFPSLYEGFGLPPLEAMSCGCPVLCSNYASLPEVVNDSALIVDPENTDAIADGILKICLDLDLRKHLIIKGVEQSGKFPWVNTARKSIELYEEILNGE